MTVNAPITRISAFISEKACSSFPCLAVVLALFVHEDVDVDVDVDVGASVGCAVEGEGEGEEEGVAAGPFTVGSLDGNLVVVSMIGSKVGSAEGLSVRLCVVGAPKQRSFCWTNRRQMGAQSLSRTLSKAAPSSPHSSSCSPSHGAKYVTLRAQSYPSAIW